jgi:integrase
VATSTHRQALSALLFLYPKVLRIDLPRLGEIGRPRTQRRLPVVLSRDEVVAVLRLLEGEHRLFAQLLYGTGMRIAEAQQLRVKDLDFAHGAVIVRSSKGGKDRVLMLPQSLVPALREQLAKARMFWSADQAAGTAGVYMPDALDRKYPRAGASWPWFWVFPQDHHSVDRAAAWCAAIICTTRPFSGPSSAPCRAQASPSRPRRIRCAMPLPRTCCRLAMTSARCRSCSVTAAWPPP